MAVLSQHSHKWLEVCCLWVLRACDLGQTTSTLGAGVELLEHRTAGDVLLRGAWT